MALYTIADLHLSTTVEKPMDIFGSRWQGHESKLVNIWNRLISPEDTVVLPGDLSWGLSLEEALPDLALIDRLPGTKYISKGNHDLWWCTVSKMKKAFEENGITSLRFLYNNAFETEDFILCGTRGWFVDEKWQNSQNETSFEKMVARESIRLETSLKEGKKLQASSGKEMLAFLHFPPIYRSFSCEPLLHLLKTYGVRRIYYGHIHGDYVMPAVLIHEGMELRIISGDYLDFIPYRITKE